MAVTDTKRTGLFTFDDFVEFLRSRPEEERWELHDGTPNRMMTPPLKAHQLIVSNVIYELMRHERASGADWFVVAGAGVHAPGQGDSAAVADVMVTFHDGYDGSYAAKPIVVIEILSPSTRRNDLGWKKAYYIEIPSLEHYLVLEQERRRATLFSRENGWQERIFKAPDSHIPLTAISARPELSELYRGLDFPPRGRA